MFWERLCELCNERNTKPTPFVKELGYSSSVVTKWKNGVIPNGKTLQEIANYFDVSVDFLLGKTDEKQNSPLDEKGINLSSHEKKLIVAYRSNPEMQSSIDKLLDVQETDVSILLEKVRARIESGELDPTNAKIAAFGGGYAVPKSEKEKERLAEIESLLKSIKEMQGNAE